VQARSPPTKPPCLLSCLPRHYTRHAHMLVGIASYRHMTGLRLFAGRPGRLTELPMYPAAAPVAVAYRYMDHGMCTCPVAGKPPGSRGDIMLSAHLRAWVCEYLRG